MVLRWILPKDGGGRVRRYVRFRKAMLSRVFITDDRLPFAPVDLFDFSHPDDAIDASRVQEKDQDAWRISDDRVIGGFSESRASFIESALASTTTLRPVGKDSILNPLDGDPKKAQEDAELRAFLRWTGNLDTTVGLRSTAHRSGFAALRSPQFPMDGANLRGLFDALEIVCRSDGRKYTVNLKVSTSIPDDIYQGQIQSDGGLLDEQGHLTGPFETFVMPFSDFRPTSMGRPREVLRQLDDNVCIESVGLALMDDRDGEFQFDLARIRAVNLLQGIVYEGEADKNAQTGQH